MYEEDRIVGKGYLIELPTCGLEVFLVEVCYQLSHLGKDDMAEIDNHRGVFCEEARAQPSRDTKSRQEQCEGLTQPEGPLSGPLPGRFKPTAPAHKRIVSFAKATAPMRHVESGAFSWETHLMQLKSADESDGCASTHVFFLSFFLVNVFFGSNNGQTQEF